MNTIKGPAIFLAQFVGQEAPFNDLESICKWAADLGYKGVQIPTWEKNFIDVAKIAESKTYADEYKGRVEACGVEITELASHLQGQLVAVHPAYDELFDGFADESVRGNPRARQEWATREVILAAKASQNLGLSAHVTFPGAFVWPYMYPWPGRATGMVDTAFKELAKRWRPILDAADAAGVDICYELHPGEDLHDGVTFERFLAEVDNHPRCCINYDPSHFVLQQLDYLQFIDIYQERIRAFHVKDAEFNPSGRAGVYGGYLDWKERPGRFRSLGDGEVDFVSIFSKLSQYGYKSWAVLEWECCIKSSDQGAKEGAPFIADHIIQVTERSFDDFATSDSDEGKNRRILGM